MEQTLVLHFDLNYKIKGVTSDCCHSLQNNKGVKNPRLECHKDIKESKTFVKFCPAFTYKVEQTLVLHFDLNYKIKGVTSDFLHLFQNSKGVKNLRLKDTKGY